MSETLKVNNCSVHRLPILVVPLLGSSRKEECDDQVPLPGEPYDSHPEFHNKGKGIILCGAICRNRNDLKSQNTAD